MLFGLLHAGVPGLLILGWPQQLWVVGHKTKKLEVKYLNGKDLTGTWQVLKEEAERQQKCHVFPSEPAQCTVQANQTAWTDI